MRDRLCNHIKNLLLPCLVFSVAAGLLSALWVTAFKLTAEGVVHLSASIYGGVRANPMWLAALVPGAAVLGLGASFIFSLSHSCRGGGIPTSVAAIRGIVSFKWLASVFVLPISALLTFLCGLPLGTEGPCVQMGTAIGDGVVKCLGKKKHKGWRRYIMTGGASAGFSIATSSPITAIIFSMEELHKHFSPLLLTVASLSVITAQITVQMLASLGVGSGRLFHLSDIATLDIKLLFAPLIVGVICGMCAILFTRFYHLIDKLLHAALEKLSVKIVFPVLFACVAILGYFISDTLGTGHSLLETLFHTKLAWYMLLLVFLVRAVFMMISNTAGVTGGVFLPTLAFGGIIGSLCAEGMIALGWIGEEHYILIVVLGVAAFLGATSRIPLTACVFAIEALGGINNVLPIIISTVVALLVIEASGLEDFTDTVIDAKLRAISRGKKPMTAVTPLTVARGSLAVGMELRDILWPNSCVVVSFERAGENHGKLGIGAGDIITVRYETCDPASTAEEFKALVGEQPDAVGHAYDQDGAQTEALEIS